jgi:RimJ/RimL family protein N-acetyltransferase
VTECFLARACRTGFKRTPTALASELTRLLRPQVFEDNIPAISLYRKFGFIEEGRKRKAIKTNNGYKDIILMGKFL